MRNREKTFLAKIAEHCVTAAKCHKAALDGDEMDHQTMMDSWEGLGSHCVEMAKAVDDELEKAFGPRGDDWQPMPQGLSVVTPTPPGVRAVPRAGQRAVSEVPQVDEHFKKIIAIDEDTE